MSFITAAVVTSFDEPPRPTLIEAPAAAAGQELVDVLAVGIHPATRDAAAGKHYTNTKLPPIVAGIDGVVRRGDGSLAMVMAPESGTMAERIAVDPGTLIPLPGHPDPATVAATMNPALSPWVALHARAGFQPDQTLMVIGATGNAGGMAVRVGKLMGASRVIAAGRNQKRLEQLLTEGADNIVTLTEDAQQTAASFAAVAADVDVVLDYVWGATTENAIAAIDAARTDHVKVLDRVQMGDMGGTAITLDGHLFRHNALRISGSGFGSVAMERADLAGLAAAVTRGDLVVTPRPVPLADVEAAWAHDDARGERTVIMVA